MDVNRGTSEDLKKDPKTTTVVKRSIDDRNKVTRRLVIGDTTDAVLDQLAAILGMPRGQVADIAIKSYAIAYNVAITIQSARPEIKEVADYLAELIVYK